MQQHTEDLTDLMLKNLELNVKTTHKKQLALYTEILLEGLKRQRLTGEKTAEGILGKQIYDSLYPLKLIDFHLESTVLDLGSGGGLPGIPLKICKPEIIISLMDSNQRKINFLKGIADNLGLERLYLLCGRAEEYGQSSNHREKYDYVVSKAVARAAVLVELTLPLVKVGGKVLLYKGSRADQEIADAKGAIQACGGNIDQVWYYKLISGEQRALYQLVKHKSTPLKYPRKIGVPARKPIK